MSKKTSIQSGALAVLVLVAGTLWYRNGSSAGASDGQSRPGASYRPMSVENPQIHWERLTDLQEAEDKTTGRDIFNWQLPPPPPPPPPQLPLKFFGIGTDSKGSARRAFLTNGSEVFIVAEGETVLGRVQSPRRSRPPVIRNSCQAESAGHSVPA